MKSIDKNIVKSAAIHLIQKYGSTTDTDVKNRLKNTGYQAFKADVSRFMEELTQEQEWKTTQVHNYIVYQPKVKTDQTQKDLNKTKPETKTADPKEKYAHLLHQKITSCKIHYYNLTLTEKQEAKLLSNQECKNGYILSTKNVGCVLNWPLDKLSMLRDTLSAKQWNIQKFPANYISFSGQKLKKQEAFLLTHEMLRSYAIHSSQKEIQLVNLEVHNENLATVELTLQDQSTIKLSKFELSLENELKPLLIKIIDYTIQSSN